MRYEGKTVTLKKGHKPAKNRPAVIKIPKSKMPGFLKRGRRSA